MQMPALRLRKFRGPVPHVAQDWYQNPLQTIQVTKLGDYSATADGACRVSFFDTIVGFVKPRPDSQNPLVVANEKIAADLAFALHLPVAPVVIRLPMDGTEWTRYSALSLSCLSAGRHWGEAPLAHCDATAPALEALRVFWSWIGDVDHGGHPANLLYETNAEGCQFVAIDHSYAFGHGNGDVLTVAASAGYGAHDHESARSARIAALDDIEALDWQIVEHIVNRLVDSVLVQGDAIRILAWLNQRRPMLRELMNVGGKDG